MAGKQLGKLRQWAGEVISTREKTIASEELLTPSFNIESRKHSLWRLQVASEGYYEFLSKKKQCEVIQDAEKLLPVDALGTVMIQHGQEYHGESAYGVALENLGQAHCKIATLQETYAMMFESAYIASLLRAEDEIKEYHALRKKLESRRLSLDAAITKLEKIRNSKKEKEKERVEAEDEFERAQSRYEETVEDLRVRMQAIKENEALLLRDLRELLDFEMNFVEQSLEVLRDVKASWPEESNFTRPGHRSHPSSLHSFGRTTPAGENRSNSVRSMKSLSKHASLSSDEDEDERRPTPSRASSKRSKASRKRSDSAATAVSEKERRKERDDEKDKERSRRMSMAGLANAIGLGKKEKDKDKDKDNFATLRDGELASDSEFDSDVNTGRRTPNGRRGSKSASGTPNASPRASLRSLLGRPSPAVAKGKIAVALYDFAAGKADELSFRAGDKIGVLNEVLDGWWMGELNGRRGLFPTTYVEVVSPSSSFTGPPLPQRPQANSYLDPARNGNGGGDKKYGYRASEEDEHPFGDHNVPISPIYGMFGGASDAGTVSENDEEERLMPARRSEESIDEWRVASSRTPPLPSGRMADADDTPVKRAPPPPPPRRMTVTGPAPVLPARPPGVRARGSQSSGSLKALVDDGITSSPFD